MSMLLPPHCVHNRPVFFAEASMVKGKGSVDLLLVNPPSPDGDTWIRCQHRAGRRASDGTVWPQVALAQLAALFPDRHTVIIDANARRLDWRTFAAEVRSQRPRWYVSQVAGPTLRNDLQGVALAKQAGAITVLFGPTVTPRARELLQRFPALDCVIYGEPEATLRELIDMVEGSWAQRPPQIHRLYAPAECLGDELPRTLGGVRGLAWRNHKGEIIVNAPRPLIQHLGDLPQPAHDLLPLSRYGAPAVQAPTAVVVTSRGCPGNCHFCLKHVIYGDSARLRPPEHILDELLQLQSLGVRHVYMQADQFTVCRDQVAHLCRLLIAEQTSLSWSCSSRVESVDKELLQLMGQAGCRWITWAIESGSDMLLWRNGKGAHVANIEPAIGWARAAGIHNWGSFILGLPGESERTIQQTIALARRLDLDHITFDLAVPHPGTPFWEEALAARWLRPGLAWEEADPGGPAILNYPELGPEQLEAWRERAYREWALRPGSRWGELRRLAQARNWSRPYEYVPLRGYTNPSPLRHTG